MSAVKLDLMVVESQPYFSALWLGRHPSDGEPRVVACFGPSVPQDSAGVQATVLGLQPVTLGSVPPLTAVRGALDHERLVLHAGAEELWRTEPVPLSLATVLQRRAELLLVWVDVPLRDPRSQLSLVGLHHVWTGIAVVSDTSARKTAPTTWGRTPQGRDQANHCRTAPARRTA